MNILVVDDDFVCRTMMHKVCEQLGQCRSVDGGQAAVAAFASALDAGSPFDVITLDKSLPDLDGIEVLRRIREEEERRCLSQERKVKIVMVTGSLEQEDHESCLAAGCDSYLVKPFRRKVITQLLEHYQEDEEKDGGESELRSTPRIPR